MIKLKDLISEGKYYGSADWKKMVKDIANYKPAPRDLQGLHKVIQWVFDDSVFKLTDKNGKYMMDDLRKQPKLKKLFREGNITEAKETGIDIAKRIVKNHQHEKGVDVQTANLILKIHQAYAKNPALQKKFEKLPLKKLAQGVWRFVK